jgi:hypothetical protein
MLIQLEDRHIAFQFFLAVEASRSFEQATEAVLDLAIWCAEEEGKCKTDFCTYLVRSKAFLCLV